MIDRGIEMRAIGELAGIRPQLMNGSKVRANMSEGGGSAKQSRDRKRRSVVAVTLPLHLGLLSVRKL